jgi:serine/threonine protein kinase
MRGQVIARRYRITDTIGAGGMGTVHEAIDLETGCEVALKALQPGAYDPVRLKRLRREAKAMTAVRSEHVCKVHYLGVERGTPFIVMERLRGETLRTRLTDDPSMPVGEAVQIFCQLLDALTATHDAGFIHRDVKPSNVFLTARPKSGAPCVKLIDFGLAKAMKSGGTSRDHALECELTSAEAVAGTLHFLAPEQLLSVGDLDERVDVYAAGVTLFEMLAGHRAYTGTYSEVIHDIVFSEPPKITTSRPDLPPVFDHVLGMAMAKSRERRFSSAAAFKRALMAAWDTWMQDAPFQSGVCPMMPEVGDEIGLEPGTLRPSPPPRLVSGSWTPAPSSGSVVDLAELAEQARAEATILDEDLPTLRPPPPGARIDAIPVPPPPRRVEAVQDDASGEDLVTLRPPPGPPALGDE